jgi:flagellin-like protein
MHNAAVYALQPDTKDGGYRIGYSGTYNYGGLDIENNTLVGMASFGTGKGYYGNAPVVRFINNTVTHHRIAPKSSVTYYEDVCTMTSGVPNSVISGNTMYDCGVGFFVPNNYYATSSYYGGTGTDDLTVSDNTIVDANNLGIWFYLNSMGDNVTVSGNTITGGTIPSYGVYVQDDSMNGINITGNTIHAEDPIYMRGAKEWNITDNTIIGISSASNAGIYVRYGHGLIEGNTLIDADGGINVFGIYSEPPTTQVPYPPRYSIDINDNTVAFSSGRTPTSASGISIEECGSTQTATGVQPLWVNTSNNDVEVISNALVTNECRVHDTGSSFTSMGGAAGRVHTVSIMGSTYSPENLTINVGDTVRWRLVQYSSDPNNYQHSTTADNGDWDSGLMNLGSTFTHTFTTAGAYGYACSVHPLMTGNVTVVAGSTAGLSSTGINVAGSDDVLILDGTAVSGFGVGISQYGGALSLTGGSLIVADTHGVDAYDVDFTADGATIGVDDNYGVAMDIRSPAGLTGGQNVLDIANVNVDNASVALKADGHKEFRWNGGLSAASTTLETVGTASGTIENMTWTNTGTQIDAGAFSVITSIGNGMLDPTKLVIASTAIVHEGNLLDLTVTHMGNSATNVGLVVRSTEAIDLTGFGIPVNLSGNSRSEYVSASWRSKVGAEGTGINADSDLSDWYGEYTENIADDMMPGQVAMNHNSVPTGDMKITWDDDNMYIAFSGVTFSATDGMIYLDTRPGGSTSGDTWYVSHDLPFMADYMLFAEDWTTWGIREVNPQGTWIDVTNQCTGLDSAVAYGYPGVTPTWDFDSEFILPWGCLGAPTSEVRWLAIVQNETNGGVLGAYPPANILAISIDDPSGGQSFVDFGTFMLDNSEDLPDGMLDDFVLIYRTFAGSTTPTTPRDYEIIVKVSDGDGYWDWGMEPNVDMSGNEDVTIDIMRAKPVISTSLIDQVVSEDSGMTSLSLTTMVSDYQTDQAAMAWDVVDDAGNDHEHSTPYTHTMNGHSLEVTTIIDQFGGHKLEVTVTDEHGLNDSVDIWYNVTNVNDKPIICNPDRENSLTDTCLPVFWDVTDASGILHLNVRDEKAVDDGTAWTIARGLGTAANISATETTTASYILDMANEQTQEDGNPFYVQNGQTYTWSAEFASDSTDCVAYSMNVQSNAISLQENASNEKGGTCTFILSLSDGVDDATDFPVSFTVNPINDQPIIPGFDTETGRYVEVGNGTIETDWIWWVMEDDENVDNLTFDISNMMDDPDHNLAELNWEVGAAETCPYWNYFSVTVDNDNEKIILDLVPDAATDAPTSEIDYLQDADGDGETDDGVHQTQPGSGVSCLVYLYLNDTTEAPSHTDYNQSGYDTYGVRSNREELRVRVINLPEARPDYTFNVDYGFDFLNIKAVLPGTRVPFDIIVENNGDAKDLYNYEHDLHVLLYTDDNPGVVQSKIIIPAADMLDTGEDKKVRGWVTLNSATTEITTFAEVRTIHPYTGAYIDETHRKPELEELNWDDNNMTTTDTNQTLPQMVQLRSATSVASFLPGLVTVSLVGMFVGLNILAGRRDEDEAEYEAITADEEAVSPVIATILLVAITVTLSGVIYVWADSLAETDTKASPRLTAIAEADTDGSQQNWAWKIEVSQHQNLLATQAVKVTVEWENSSGNQVYEVMLTDKYGPGEGFGQNTSEYGVYGRLPSNSDATVTFKDDIDCGQGGDCMTGYGSSDIIYVRMHEEDGTKIDRAIITVFYLPPGQPATPLMSYVGTYNPATISPA